MKGTIRPLAITRPFVSPHRAPAPTPAPTAAGHGQFPLSPNASTTAASATAVPADRSIPPARITTVMPSEATATVVRSAAMRRKLPASRNVPLP